MTTIQTFAQKIRQRIQAVAAVGSVTALTADVADVDVLVTVAANVGTGELADLVDGVVIEIGTELLYVTGLSGSHDLEVTRGFLGTTAVDHATGDTVWIGQPLALSAIVDHMRDEIAGWPNSLFRTFAFTVAWPARTAIVDSGLEENTDVRRILDVRRFATDGLGRSRIPELVLIREPGNDFPSGFALQIRDPTIVPNRAVEMRLVVSLGFDLTDFGQLDPTDLDLEASLEDNVGLGPSMLDILQYGVGVRILSELAAYRAELDRQGQHRNAEEVDAQTIGMAIQVWQTRYQERMSAEIRRLQETWGVRS